MQITKARVALIGAALALFLLSVINYWDSGN